MKRILQFVADCFDCYHGSLSRVFTIGGRSYRVCCDCGREFEYSWDTMSIRGPASRRRLIASLAQARITG